MSDSKTPAQAVDFSDANQLRNLLAEIMADESKIDSLSDEQLAAIEKRITPYDYVLKNSKSAEDAHMVFGFTNLRETYMKQLLTTALVGYLYRRADEYGRLYKDKPTYMDDMAAAEAELLKNQQLLPGLNAKILILLHERDVLAEKVETDTKIEAENRLKYDATKTMMSKTEILDMRQFQHDLVANIDRLRLMNKEIVALEEERDAIQAHGKRFIIRQFLDEQFRFNPDKHVRSSYVPIADAAAGPSADPICKFVPPDDTFHNFNYYADSNYEELRSVTNRLYRTTPDLEVALQSHGEFATAAEAQRFIDTNQNKVTHDLRSAPVGKWAVLEAFKKNRDAIAIGQGTVIQDILQQHEQDQRTGAELARRRATKAKTDNIKATGPAPKMASAYMNEHGTPDASAIEAKMTVEEQKKIYDAHQEEKRKYESALVKADDEAKRAVAAAAIGRDALEPEPVAPHDQLRVNVYTMLDGGAATKKSHFMIDAEKPDGANLPVVRR